MKRLLLLLGILLIMPGCKNSSQKYPKRPAKAPYYYNEISITEMDQNVRYALRKARERTGIEFVTAILKKIPRRRYLHRSILQHVSAGDQKLLCR
jgi:hypothetical protein